MDHDAHRYNNRRSGEGLRAADTDLENAFARSFEPLGERHGVRTGEANRRVSWYYGVPSTRDDERWLGYLRTAGGTVFDPPLWNSEPSDQPVELPAGNDGVPQSDIDASWSTGLDGDYVQAIIDYASGDNVYDIADGISYPCSPTFMGLPMEVRRKIYRYVLVEADVIRIMPASSTTPGITRTSRRIRGESMRVHLKENVFVLRVHSCYPIAPENFFIKDERPRHWLSRVQHLTYMWSGRHDWANLKWWLRLHHANGVHAPKAEAHHSSWVEEPCRAFVMVRLPVLKNAPWEDVRDVLELWKKSTETRHGSSGPIFWT